MYRETNSVNHRYNQYWNRPHIKHTDSASAMMKGSVGRFAHKVHFSSSFSPPSPSPSPSSSSSSSYIFIYCQLLSVFINFFFVLWIQHCTPTNGQAGSQSSRRAKIMGIPFQSHLTVPKTQQWHIKWQPTNDKIIIWRYSK